MSSKRAVYQVISRKANARKPLYLARVLVDPVKGIEAFLWVTASSDGLQFSSVRTAREAIRRAGIEWGGTDDAEVIGGPTRRTKPSSNACDMPARAIGLKTSSEGTSGQSAAGKGIRRRSDRTPPAASLFKPSGRKTEAVGRGFGAGAKRKLTR